MISNPIGIATDSSERGNAEIDEKAVKRYFDGAGGGSAAAMSMMAHEHNLPDCAARYRQCQELQTIEAWLGLVGGRERVLDVGCGAGAWTEIFAKRYRSVIGIERSHLMVDAAVKRVADLPNVEIHEGDGCTDLPDGPFDMIFLGGLCMYLKDSRVLDLLASLRARLAQGGAIIMRESTVRNGTRLAQGEYQAVYRSVDSYQRLFEESGPFSVEIRRNYGYTSLVTAEELVDLRRRWLAFLPRESPLLASMTWWSLRATTPLSLWALPRVLSRLNVSWPVLQNHFFRLRPKVKV